MNSSPKHKPKPDHPTPATPGAALEQPAKSQVTPSDSTEGLPPAWAVKAGQEIADFWLHGRGASLSEEDWRKLIFVKKLSESSAAIIARHAPPPVPVSPPVAPGISPSNQRVASETPGSRAAVSPPCKERERLLEILRNMAAQKHSSEMTDELREFADFEGGYDYFVTSSRLALTEAITFISGAAAVARKE